MNILLFKLFFFLMWKVLSRQSKFITHSDMLKTYPGFVIRCRDMITVANSATIC